LLRFLAVGGSISVGHEAEQDNHEELSGVAKSFDPTSVLAMELESVINCRPKSQEELINEKEHHEFNSYL